MNINYGLRFAAALVLFTLFCVLPATAKKFIPVNNVRFEEARLDSVRIWYDLDAVPCKYKIKLQFRSLDSLATIFTPRSIEGDFGGGIQPGKNKLIIWHAINDYPYLFGENYVCAITAQKLRPTWKDIGLSTAVAGVATGIVYSIVYAVRHWSQNHASSGGNTLLIRIPDHP
jgi:hypothetical protein